MVRCILELREEENEFINFFKAYYKISNKPDTIIAVIKKTMMELVPEESEAYNNWKNMHHDNLEDNQEEVTDGSNR